MHENDHKVASLIVTKHVFIISSRQAILKMPCIFYETTSLNTVTEGRCLSCLSTVPYTWWTLEGREEWENNSKNTKHVHDFQCNWIISYWASFLPLIGKKPSNFFEDYVSGKKNKDVICCKWWIFLEFL